jgi:hypothetical protein
MKYQKISIEQIIFIFAFLLALGVRIFQLGALPLTELEANWALQAHQLAIDNNPIIGSHTGYITFTSFLFYLFGSTEFLARILPAVVGSLIILFPYLLRKEIGRVAAVILAFGLALDPGLVAISRQAGSTSLSVVTLLLAFGFIYSRSTWWAGIFAGLFLISGPGIWSGVLSISLVLIWTYFAERKDTDNFVQKIFGANDRTETGPTRLPKTFFYWMFGTALVVSTGLLQIPTGINSIFNGISEFFQGWVTYPEIYLQQMFAGVTVYEALPLLFGVLGIGWGLLMDIKFDKFLSRWFLITSIFALVYPGRHITDLIWVIVPLWLLAARQIERIKILHFEDHFPYLGVSVFSIVIIIFGWINLANLVSNPVSGQSDLQMRVAIIIGSILLVLIVVFLVSWGWSWKIAANGLLSGMLVVLIPYTLSACWHSGGLGPNPAAEVFRSGKHIRDSDLLHNSIQDLAEWSTGQSDALELIVIKENSHALRWLLRDYDNVNYSQALPIDSNSPLMITDGMGTVTLPVAYTGQDFVWEEEPAWSLFSISNWMNWVFYRQAPFEIATVILWARSDIFPGVEPGTIQEEINSEF